MLKQILTLSLCALIATGLSKAEGLKAVLKGGYINTLMISLKLAKAILETE